MKFYFAPLEGVAGYIYRNAFAETFGGPDKYFAPFVSPCANKKMAGREIKDILPENNKVINLIPQILTNNSEHFIRGAKQIQEMGYNEINFNLGCPSGTVVSKRKGAGFLSDTNVLYSFFDDIFSKLDMKISVKTRIGLNDKVEWEHLINVYNKFPISELIVHPRTRVQMYKGIPDMESFDYSYENYNSSLCYNGNIYNINDYKNIIDIYNIDSVMIGRGLLCNPNLVNEIKGDKKIEKVELKVFHDKIYEGYRNVIGENKNLLFKMKELWTYMCEMFDDSHKCIKLIRKSQNIYKYNIAVDEIFNTMNLK